MKEVVAKAGGDTPAGVKGAKTSAKMTTVMPQGEFAMDVTVWTVYPDKVRAEINTPMGKIIQIYDGDKAWMETPQGRVDQPAKDMADDIKRSYVSILKSVGRAGITFQLLPAEGDLQIVAVKGLGEDFVLAVAKDKTIAQVRYQGKTPSGVGNIVEVYSDYKTVEGILFPFAIDARVDGKTMQKVVMGEVAFNPQVDAGAFKETPKP
jgi:outer membrane lipoprotein-sorting protein